MAATIKKREFCNFNSQDYDVFISFKNGEREISLNSHSIVELEIEESFVNWYMSGYIIIDNPFDNFERLPDFDDNPLQVPEMDYKYRGDGRDIITITIMPRPESISNDQEPVQPQNLKTEIWEIHMEGVIYDLEEIPSEDPQNKRKKFYFREKEYQLMLEKNIEFSTATSGENKDKGDIINLSNDDRSLKTGVALHELFKSVDELKDKIPEGVGPDYNWSEGSDHNKIFYTSPSNSKLIDDIEYIIHSHTGSEEEDYDICFLRFNRRVSGQPKKFSFESLGSMFKKAGTTRAGEYQIEKFTLMDLNETKKVVNIPKSPTDTPTTEKNIMVFTRNEIHSYQFTEMAGADSAELVQVFPVHSYNREKGQFNIQFIGNTPKDVKDYQKKNHASNIGPRSHPRMQLNSWMKNGYRLLNIQIHDPLTGKEPRYAHGRNQIIMSSLLNGAAIAFTCKGQTSRQAGRFFSVNKNKYNETDFDDRLEGQYLFSVVRHRFDFKTQDYSNTIVGTKFHRYGEGGATPEEDEELIK